MSTYKPHYITGADEPITKGFDMFATDDYFYIVRSDLDQPVFMRVKELYDDGKKPEIYNLPSAYFMGDHYFGYDFYKYVIHGNNVHRTGNLGKDTHSTNRKLIWGMKELVITSGQEPTTAPWE